MCGALFGVLQSAIVGALRQWHSDLPVHPSDAASPALAARSLPSDLVSPFRAFATCVALWPVSAYSAVDRAVVADFALPVWGHRTSVTTTAGSGAGAGTPPTPVTVIVGQLGSGRHRVAASIAALTANDNSYVGMPLGFPIESVALHGLRSPWPVMVTCTCTNFVVQVGRRVVDAVPGVLKPHGGRDSGMAKCLLVRRLPYPAGSTSVCGVSGA